MSSTESQRLGRMGEEAVLSRYARAGFTLVGRNVRQFPNEIDLILESDTHLVFVEVKTRHMVFGVRSRYGRPADAVTPAKRKHVLDAARTYLREHPTKLQPRIDIAEVYVTRLTDGTDQVTNVYIFPNAFGAR
jgi:putative endonuclease